jgi:phosphopantothenate synthetase
MVEIAKELKKAKREELERIATTFNNQQNLRLAIEAICKYLTLKAEEFAN